MSRLFVLLPFKRKEAIKELKTLLFPFNLIFSLSWLDCVPKLITS